MTVSSILDSLQQSPNSGATYVVFAVAVIIGFFLLKKIVKLVTFVVIFGTMGIALAALQGQDISKFTDPALAFFTSMSDKIGEATGASSAVDSAADTDVRKVISEALAKKK